VSGFRLRFEIPDTPSPEFMGSIAWAMDCEMFTEEEIIDLIADELLDKVKAVEI